MDARPGRLKRIRRRPRYQGPSFNRVVPNLLTLLGLCAGLTAIRAALDAHWAHAAVLVVVAGVIDGLDGRIARLLKAVSRFGAEFDSLADFLLLRHRPRADPVSVVPARGRALRLHALPDVRRVHGAAPGAFQRGNWKPHPKPAFAQSFFTGVPAPAGAGVVLLPLFLWLEAEEQGWARVSWFAREAPFVAAMLVGASLLLVSTLPVWSFKNFKVPTAYVLPLLLGTGLMAALLMADPWAALAACGVAYLLMLPFSLRSFRRLRAEAAGG